MELTHLLERLKMDHLLAQLDGVCEQAAKAISRRYSDNLDAHAGEIAALELEFVGQVQFFHQPHDAFRPAALEMINRHVR